MKNILIVEDDKNIIMLLCDYLKGKYKLFLSETVEEAKVKLSSGKFDLVICDYNLPDGTGIEVVDYMKNRQLMFPVVFFTGNYCLDVVVEFPIVKIICEKNFILLLEMISSYF